MGKKGGRPKGWRKYNPEMFLNFLSNDWQLTSTIHNSATKCYSEINWRSVKESLEALKSTGFVEKKKLGRQYLWRRVSR